jgi:hypothetical protein
MRLPSRLEDERKSCVIPCLLFRQSPKNLPWVVNNSRFLIFPWVRVANLASHALGHLARRAAEDWELRWGYRPLLLETFVDPAHFRGSCYRAGSWTLLGRTSGEGLVRPGKQYRTSPKLIFAKALQAAIGFIRSTLSGPWLNRQEIDQRLNRPLRLRLL